MNKITHIKRNIKLILLYILINHVTLQNSRWVFAPRSSSSGTSSIQLSNGNKNILVSNKSKNNHYINNGNRQFQTPSYAVRSSNPSGFNVSINGQKVDKNGDFLSGMSDDMSELSSMSPLTFSESEFAKFKSGFDNFDIAVDNGKSNNNMMNTNNLTLQKDNDDGGKLVRQSSNVNGGSKQNSERVKPIQASDGERHQLVTPRTNSGRFMNYAQNLSRNTPNNRSPARGGNNRVTRRIPSVNMNSNDDSFNLADQYKTQEGMQNRFNQIRNRRNGIRNTRNRLSRKTPNQRTNTLNQRRSNLNNFYQSYFQNLQNRINRRSRNRKNNIGSNINNISNISNINNIRQPFRTRRNIRPSVELQKNGGENERRNNRQNVKRGVDHLIKNQKRFASSSEQMLDDIRRNAEKYVDEEDFDDNNDDELKEIKGKDGIDSEDERLIQEDKDRREREKLKKQEEMDKEKKMIEREKRLEREREKKREQDRIEKEKRDRMEQERVQRQRMESNRREQERIEQDRREQERMEQERIEQERMEQDRRVQERNEQERIEQERREQERIEQERMEQDRKEQERMEKKRMEQERMEEERKMIEREKRLDKEREKEKLRIKAIEKRDRKRQRKLEKEKERLKREERLEKERLEREERNEQIRLAKIEEGRKKLAQLRKRLEPISTNRNSSSHSTQQDPDQIIDNVKSAIKPLTPIKIIKNDTNKSQEIEKLEEIVIQEDKKIKKLSQVIQLQQSPTKTEVRDESRANPFYEILLDSRKFFDDKLINANKIKLLTQEKWYQENRYLFKLEDKKRYKKSYYIGIIENSKEPGEIKKMIKSEHLRDVLMIIKFKDALSKTLTTQNQSDVLAAQELQDKLRKIHTCELIQN